jgi:RND family efflux transporter MFP subunit
VDETLNQFRAAEAARAEADAMVQSAQAGVNEAQAKVHSAQADLVAAEAHHRVAQADLKKANTMLEYSVIRAPFDGVVTRRGVDSGHFVQPANGGASAPLLVVARCEQVRVFVDVPEMEAALVDIGDPAIVRVQAMGDGEFPAKVTRTSWSLDSSNRSLRTEIDIDNPEKLLRPGMYATVTILLDQRQSALALPVTAVMREGREAYCWCVESGKAQRRKITLGLHSGGEVEIVSGLADNDTVVLTRPDSLEQGQQVEVMAPEQ